MTISRPTFFVDTHGFSFLKFIQQQQKYSTSVDLRISNYSFSKPSFYGEFEMYLRSCQERGCTLHLDGSTELLSYEVFQYLRTREGTLNNLTLYTNGPDNPGFRPNSLCRLGAEVIELPFFIKFQEYYQPTPSQKDLEYKKYSLLTGTPKYERSVLIGLLQSYDLIEHGHISYFGVNQYGVISEHLERLHKDTTCPEDLKKRCKQGLEKLDTDLVIDENIFDYNIGTARVYNNQPFLKSDINIAIESHLHNSIHFFTEKISKPIQNKNKILLAGVPNSISLVIDLYKKYCDVDVHELFNWTNIEYDRELNLYKRFDLICKELLKQF